MDVAIEYKAKLMEVKRVIDALNSVGIKGQKYLKALNEIEEEVKKDIDEKNNNKGILVKNSSVGIYTKAISNLEMLKMELQKYNDYIEGYHYCEYLESVISGDKITPTEVNDYSKKIIELMTAINNSDTRDYEEEEVVVEKIYLLAYSVMKLEFEVIGKSEIYDTVKDNPIMESFINNEIKKDIDSLSEEKRNSGIIKSSLNKAMSSGINYSYLDKVLITTLALNDENSVIKKIEDNLRELYNTIVFNSKKIEKSKKDLNLEFEFSTKLLQKLKVQNYNNRIELLKRTGAIVASLGIVFGAYKISKGLFTDEKYFTTKESYSSAFGYSKDESYQDKISDFNSLYLYKYEPYKKKGNEYYRDYSRYDVSNINSDKLEDYLNVDLDLANYNVSDYQKKASKDMTEEDFYDEVLYEVVKIVQNPDDVRIEEHIPYTLFITFMLSIFGNLFLLGGLSEFGFFDGLDFDKYKKRKLQDQLLKIKKSVEAYRRLIDNNKEVKERFSKAYETYKPLLESAEFKNELSKMFDIVNTEDLELELDRREQKLLQKVKKKDSLN